MVLNAGNDFLIVHNWILGARATQLKAKREPDASAFRLMVVWFLASINAHPT